MVLLHAATTTTVATATSPFVKGRFIIIAFFETGSVAKVSSSSRNATELCGKDRKSSKILCNFDT
jgi:hypothetical protein